MTSASPPAWHMLPVAEACAELGSSRVGITTAEAGRRLAEVGANELESVPPPSVGELVIGQLRNVLIVILLVATALSAVLGHPVEALAIAVIVVFAVALGVAQEYRAERAIEALRTMTAPSAAVLRDGEETEVPATEVVPGDVLVLRVGDRIAADGRLIEAVNLQVQEAVLTGESLPADKGVAALGGSAVQAGDRLNMVFAGTAVTYGRGEALVVATGMQTEVGRIAGLLATVETSRTPLQHSLDRLGELLARAALVLVFVVVLLGLARGQPFVDMLLFGTALAVAVVPEALPAVVAISLALGVQRLARRHALMRRLSAVETLGSTSVICSDKTGTLTRDEMTVRRILVGGEWLEVGGVGYAPDGVISRSGAPVDCAPTSEDPVAAPLRELLEAAVLAGDATLVHDLQEGVWRVRGDPTEAALVVAAAKAGLHRVELEACCPRVAEVPFTSETKRMTTVHVSTEGRSISFAKGAPEVILASCVAQRLQTGVEPLDATARGDVLDAAHDLAAGALRVLAVAAKPGAAPADAETGMVFLGLVGMLDPPREEAAAALRTCEAAGIRAVMITGDHPLTAQAVARELGLGVGGRVVTGAELEAMSDGELELEVDRIDVYARVSPEHKLRVVDALQKRGHVVAMTGDGVNDAPALKKADIGVAMGISGTDVAREAAAMTLTDDDFATIVAAVEEGRVIFGNIKKYLMFLLSSNIGEIGLMVGASLAGLPLPLAAVQILYVNLATDGLPALALAVDPPEGDLMRRSPRDPRRGIFTRPVVTLMLVAGAWAGLVNLLLFWWLLESGRDEADAMAMTFVSLVLIQFWNALNFRSDRLSAFTRPFANRWLDLAIVWELSLLVLIVYVPFLQGAFGTFALSARDWCAVMVLSLTIVPVIELAKWVERRGWLGSMG